VARGIGEEASARGIGAATVGQAEADPLLDDTLETSAAAERRRAARAPIPSEGRGALRQGREGQYHGRLARQRRRARDRRLATAGRGGGRARGAVGRRDGADGRRRRGVVVAAEQREGRSRSSRADRPAHVEARARGALGLEDAREVSALAVRVGADGRVVVPFLVEDDDAGVEVGGCHDGNMDSLLGFFSLPNGKSLF